DRRGGNCCLSPANIWPAERVCRMLMMSRSIDHLRFRYRRLDALSAHQIPVVRRWRDHPDEGEHEDRLTRLSAMNNFSPRRRRHRDVVLQNMAGAGVSLHQMTPGRRTVSSTAHPHLWAIVHAFCYALPQD